MNLNQITIPVLNVERSIEFYEQLGLQLIVRNLPAYARFTCPDGCSTFSLHEVTELPTGGGVWMYFETEDIDTKVQHLISKGFAFETLPTDQPWLWREARLKDPDYNQLILYYAGKNRTDPPWKIG